MHTHFVVKQYSAAWLGEVLVYKGEDVDIVLRPHWGGDDGMVVINDFFQGTHSHWGATQVINL